MALQRGSRVRYVCQCGAIIEYECNTQCGGEIGGGVRFFINMNQQAKMEKCLLKGQYRAFQPEDCTGFLKASTAHKAALVRLTYPVGCRREVVRYCWGNVNVSQGCSR